jgi:metal-sulfur cluster biosynthetic enzyme
MDETVPESIGPQDGEATDLHQEIQKGLRGIIDPGTGLDVIRMGLVRDTRLEKAGKGCRAILTFRPSSPVCPMAFKLAWDIKKAVETVDGIETVEVKVEGYNRASELEAVLREKEDESTAEP